MGLPLRTSATAHFAPTVTRLSNQMFRALKELSNGSGGQDHERKKECVSALLLALKNHFPNTFKSQFAKSPLVNDFLLKARGTRLIKLQRMACARLAEYL